MKINEKMRQDWDERSADPFTMTLTGAGDGEFYWNTGIAQARDLAKVLRLKRKSKVMELGCGIGRVAIPMAALADVEALDISAKMLAQTSQYAKLLTGEADPQNPVAGLLGSKGLTMKLSLIKEDGFFPLPDASMDAAYEILCIQHMPVDVFEATARELSRVLKPKGLLCIKDITGEAEIASIAKGPGDNENTWTSRTYSLEEYRAILGPLGFSFKGQVRIADRTQSLWQRV